MRGVAPVTPARAWGKPRSKRAPRPRNVPHAIRDLDGMPAAHRGPGSGPGHWRRVLLLWLGMPPDPARLLARIAEQSVADFGAGAAEVGIPIGVVS